LAANNLKHTHAHKCFQKHTNAHTQRKPLHEEKRKERKREIICKSVCGWKEKKSISLGKRKLETHAHTYFQSSHTQRKLLQGHNMRKVRNDGEEYEIHF